MSSQSHRLFAATAGDTLQQRVTSAELLVQAGQLAEAYDQYVEIVFARREELGGDDATGWTAADAAILDRAADLAVLTGSLPDADDLLATLGAAAVESGNELLQDYALVKRVDVARMWRGADDAMQLLTSEGPHLVGVATDDDVDAWERESAIVAWPEEHRRTIMGRLLLVLSEVMLLRGDYSRARALLRALDDRIADRTLALAHEPTLRAQARLAAATIALECGDWETLATERESARAYDTSVASVVRIDELAARESAMRGDYGAALDAWRRVCAACDAQQLHTARVQARQNLAEVLILVNQTTEATSLIDEAMQVAKALDDEFGWRRGEALLALRDARLRSSSARESLCQSVVEMVRGPTRGRSNSARVPLDGEALARVTDRESAAAAAATTSALDGHLARFDSAELTVLTQLAAGDAGRALEQYERLAPRFRGSESPIVRARVQALEARVAYYGGDWKRAQAAIDLALPALRQLGLARDLREAELLRGWCAAREGAAEEHRAAVGASEALVDLMARSLSPEERAVFLLNKFSSDEERLSADVARLRALQEEAAAASWFGRIALWRTILEATLALRARTDVRRTEIAEEVLRGRRIADSERPSVAPRAPSLMQAMFGERSGEATLSFLVLPLEMVAILTWRRGVRAEVVPITRLELRHRVARWHAAQAKAYRSLSRRVRGGGVDEDEDPSTGADDSASLHESMLADLGLVALLAELPAQVTTLRIVPDDVLHGVPWAGLRMGDGFLVQRFALVIGHEAASQRGAPQTVVFDGANALLLGVASAAGSFGALEAVPEELDRVEQVLSVQQVRVTRMDEQSGRRARRVDVLAALPQTQLFHAASHGTFVVDRPDQSGLVLVPDDDGRFEVLTVRDLARLDLQHLQHVVLSSCWSSDSYVSPGRWIVSLPETLWRAGVGLVLASLWPVVDELGPLFLERYYGYLATSPPAIALQRVQLDCIEGRVTLPTANAALVQLWAGFQVHS